MGCGKPCNCGSYREHLLSVSFGAAAMPSRRGDAIATNEREARLELDAPAYKRLRQEGLQPARIDGCHRLEAKATTTAEIEVGALVSDFAT